MFIKLFFYNIKKKQSEEIYKLIIIELIEIFTLIFDKFLKIKIIFDLIENVKRIIIFIKNKQ